MLMIGKSRRRHRDIPSAVFSIIFTLKKKLEGNEESGSETSLNDTPKSLTILPITVYSLSLSFPSSLNERYSH